MEADVGYRSVSKAGKWGQHLMLSRGLLPDRMVLCRDECFNGRSAWQTPPVTRIIWQASRVTV
jgi:hypothetical protein